MGGEIGDRGDMCNMGDGGVAGNESNRSDTGDKGNWGGKRRRPEKERKEVEVRRKIYEDHHMRIIFWQQISRVIGFQKKHGLFGLNHHIISKKMCDVTPVTAEQTDREGGISGK